MEVYFDSSVSEVDVRVGQYEEFSPSPKTRLKQLTLVGLSFGLLCVLQAVLNISLRLTLTREQEEATVPGSLTTPRPTQVNTTADSSPARCPEGWLLFQSSCYFISSQRADFDSSRRDCERRQAQLVQIETRDEQFFLTGFSAAIWVGMTDRNKEGTWLWLDGTPVQKKRLQWAPGQPDDSGPRGEDCGDIRTMVDFIGLNDSDCSNREQWVCEKRLERL